MAEDKKDLKIVRVEHENIYAALSAFQGENPEIKKTKRFGKEGDKMSFMYAPLDEVLGVVRPLLAKHGLSVTHTGTDEVVAVLYHTSYKRERYAITTVREFEGTKETVTSFGYDEEGVIRSAPVKVKRAGDMKIIGTESTYARRYTLAEVLGVAPDEDTDVSVLEGRVEKLEGFAFVKAKEGVMNSKTDAEIMKQIEFFKKDIATLELNDPKKTPSLGLKREQYDELMTLAATRRIQINNGSVGAGAPGENQDGGGEGSIS